MMFHLAPLVAQIALVQLYWFSLLVIGSALFSILAKKLQLNYKWRDNVFLSILVSFALGVGILGAFSVAFYLLRTPSWVYSAAYILLACCSVVYLFRSYVRAVFVWLRTLLRQPSLVAVMLLFVLLAALGFDYVFSLYVGNQFAEGSDAYVHVAKIVTLLQGFTFEDGFLQGVSDSRYLLNIVYPLYIPPVQLIPGFGASEVWFYSLAFFRFMQWIAAGALAVYVLSKWVGFKKRTSHQLAVGAILISMTLFAGWNTFMHVATYPNKVVTLWFVLLVIGYAAYVKSGARQLLYLVILSAALITLTHPTYSLMAAMFVSLYGLAVTVLGQKVAFDMVSIKQKIVAFALPVAILLVSPLITLAFPDRMTEESFDYGEFSTVQILGANILRPSVPDNFKDIALAAVVVIGYVFLLMRMWRRGLRSGVVLIFCLLLFFPLIAYNPVFMGISKDILPLWLIARFSAMNVLGTLAMFLGLIAIYYWLQSFSRQRAKIVAQVVLSLIVVTIFGGAAKTSYENFYDGTKGIDHGYADFLRRTEDQMKDMIPPGSVVVANEGDSYFLPAAIPVKVVAIHEAHATPEAASSERLACQKTLLDDLSPAGLKAVGADYVVIPPWDPRFKKLNTLLATRSEFTFIAKTSDYWIYKVNRHKILNATQDGSVKPCTEYRKIEG